eukprot:1037869-Amphidinium_carterae.1
MNGEAYGSVKECMCSLSSQAMPSAEIATDRSRSPSSHRRNRSESRSRSRSFQRKRPQPKRSRSEEDDDERSFDPYSSDPAKNSTHDLIPRPPTPPKPKVRAYGVPWKKPIICFFCGGQGHIARLCPYRGLGSQQQAAHVQSLQCAPRSAHAIAENDHVKSESDDKPKKPTHRGGKRQHRRKDRVNTSPTTLSAAQVAAFELLGKALRGDLG